MSPERYQQLAHAIATLQAAGQSVSTHKLHRLVGGSYPQLVKDLKAFRTQGARAESAASGPEPGAAPGVALQDPPPLSPLPPTWCPRCCCQSWWLVESATAKSCWTCGTQVRLVGAPHGGADPTGGGQG